MNERDKQWNMKYEKLVEFKRKKGDCMVPCACEHDKSLGIWVRTQRTIHKNDKMRSDRKELLEKIGFAWKDDRACYDKLWHQHCEKLIEFKRKSGHCMVPCAYGQDKSLGLWVSKQRNHHINNKLGIDRKERLDEIGFAWKDGRAYNDKLWHQQCEKLVEFKRTNGHCVVPNKYEQDKSLGIWVRMQRSIQNNNKMRSDRKELLDEIGFAWKDDGTHTTYKTNDKFWHQQYEKLVDFKRKSGHCMVLCAYEQDKSLGIWVSNQRRNHNKMRPDRKKLLDEIGFAWKAHTVQPALRKRSPAVWAPQQKKH
jgi:hypothetical protein